MADPLSIAASVLAVSTAAVQSARLLQETVKRYRGRDKTLQRLQDGLQDLCKMLGLLAEAASTEEPILKLLTGPVTRCSEVCDEFKLSMEVFSSNSKTGFRDWARMEFMRGDINEFIETVTGYKSTISIVLGVITLHNSKVSQSALQEYNEMIKDTTYSLELHLQRIDEKLTGLTTGYETAAATKVDLKDEKEVTRQCLRICDEASSFLQTITIKATPLLNGPSQSNADEHTFEAQTQMRCTLDETRSRLADTSLSLSKRLQALLQDPKSSNENERLRLQEDINISKQCLQICNEADTVSRQKIYKVGEVLADGHSDQVVVNTLADMFDVGKAVSKDHSAQLIGFMSDESFRYATEKRYDSRFGTVAGESATVGATDPQPRFTGPRKASSLDANLNHDQQASQADDHKPSPNEMRRRAPGSDKM